MIKVITATLVSCIIGVLTGILIYKFTGSHAAGQVVVFIITYRALVVIANPVLERYKQEKLNNNK
jgi:O-antigen/teichoic acid export membrane protein